MDTLLDILQQEWALRAFIASSLVGVMCGVLGCFIVLRNMSLIGDALSHAILPGVVFAFIFLGYSTLGFFIGSVLAGIITAVAITWIQHRVGTKNDAAVGIVFTAMFSIGVIGISWISRSEGVHLDLKDFLFGNVLGVSDQDLILTAVVTGYVLLSVIVFYRYLFVTTFQPVIAQTMGISTKVIHYFLMLLLSFAVVASLQTVGVILVVAMLITPAATALLLSNRLGQVLVLAALFGFAAAVTGLLSAILLETTPGPAMTVTATVFYLGAVVFAPNKGLLAQSKQKRDMQRRIRLEDLLKQAYRLSEKGQLQEQQLMQRLDMTALQLKRYIRRARQKKWLNKDALSLTPTGSKQAQRMVRAHRLWETYQVDRMGLTAEQIHDEAEYYEHHLTDDILEEVDQILGFPAYDPHGSPIPTKMAVLNGYSLAKIELGSTVVIAEQQINGQATNFLWQHDLMAGTGITLREKNSETIMIFTANGQEIRLPIALARQINVEI